MPISVYKAEGVSGQEIPNLHIVATEVIPSFSGTDAEGRTAFFRAIYRFQANELAIALRACLPGGTIDELLIALLDAKASSLRVPGP